MSSFIQKVISLRALEIAPLHEFIFNNNHYPKED
nr:MAG TPA: hypothetical protein [Caudoviricetes sp.]DAO09455.1 MAG TPA: hypothetical protein [Caudoviricetes sp.]